MVSPQNDCYGNVQMFVAQDKRSDRRVNCLDPRWRDQVDLLREHARAGHLTCPGCEDFLWFRLAVVRRPHFAHRSLKNCPLGQDSIEVQDAKARLYQWLQGKYGDKVQMEINLEIPGWDRFADLVVAPSSGKRFAYYVFDRQQRQRSSLLGSMDYRFIHVVHTQSAHVPVDGGVRLSASHRDFIRISDYDRPHGAQSGHLYFLNSESGELTICRGLRCVHEPNVYAAQCTVRQPIERALISPKNGEIVLPADVERRDEWREAEFRRNEEARRDRERRAREAVERKKREAEEGARKHAESEERQRVERERKEREREEREKWKAEMRVEVVRMAEARAREAEEQKRAREKAAEPAINFDGPFRCEMCGQNIVRDYAECSPGRGTCICKPCNRQRWLTARGEPADQ